MSNKRLSKKILNQNKIKVNKININPDEYVIMTYDMDIIGIDSVLKLHNYLSSKDKFKGKVIALPKDISMDDSMGKEKVIEYLENYIEKLKKDK